MDDSDTLAAHFSHPNYLKMVELLGNANVKSSVNQAYLVERGEPVYGPNGEMKEGFLLTDEMRCARLGSIYVWR